MRPDFVRQPAEPLASMKRLFAVVPVAELPVDGMGVPLMDPATAAQERIHRDYVYVSDFAGADPTGNADSTAQVLAAQATGKLIRLDGFYRVNGGAISMTTQGIVGEGAMVSGLKIATPGHAITIPPNAGYDRRPLRLENFAIDSVGNCCDGSFAIYAPGVAAGARPIYNSGLNVRGLTVGLLGRMGGFARLKDFFNVDMQAVHATDVSRMLRLIGSVVGHTYQSIRSNNVSAASVLNRWGISTEAASYADGQVLTPENLAFRDCAYIRGDRGINHSAGLMVDFDRFDTEADSIGAMLNAACSMNGGILAPGSNANAWTGLYRGIQIADDDDATVVDGVDINCLGRQPKDPDNSFGIDAGDGVSPVRGLIVRDTRTRGLPKSLRAAFRGRILNDLVYQTNFIRHDVVKGEFDVEVSGENLHLTENFNAGGAWRASDGGSTSAGGNISSNKIASLKFAPMTRSNWTIAKTGAVST